MRRISRARIKHATSPLVGFATLAIGLSIADLFSLPVSSKPNPQPSFHQVTWTSQPTVQTPEANVEIKQTVEHEPKVVQSAIVYFPRHRAVRVESIEQVGKFPKIVFTDAKTRAVLYRSAITDANGRLKPTDDQFTQPFLRFREIKSTGLPSPLIMAVAVIPGGSDNSFYLSVFGEVNGQVTRLTNRSIFANIQGGLYLGFLNRRFGYGLAVWGFIWGKDPGEYHYGSHHYAIDVYQLKQSRFRKIFSISSREKYYQMNCEKSLREIGVRAADQREGIQQVKDFLD